MKTTTHFSKYLLVVIALFVFKTTFAQDGTLDTTFDADGILLPSYGSLESENLFLKVQPDAKIITAETVSQAGTNSQYYVRRYDSSGFHDSAFGVGGIVISNFGGLTARLYGMELQADGKMLIAGLFSGTGGGPFIGRYNSDGTLDSTFGTGGIANITSDNLQSFTLQSDGKILVGRGFNGGANKLSRYNSNGALDAGFGVAGSIDIALLKKLSVQSDGKILVTSGNNNFVIKRYSSSGTIDTTFGTGGTVTINVDDYEDIISIKAQSDGKISFIGNSQNLTTYASAYKLIRLLSNGSLDSSFGTGGMVSLQIISGQLGVQSDGKIIVAGSYPLADGPNKLAVSRFLINGSLDSTFGTNGMVVTAFPVPFSDLKRILSANNVEISTDGKIVVGGTFSEANSSSNPSSFVVRYNTAKLSTTDFDTNKSSFIVYPNPVNEIVNVDFNLTQSQVLSMDLYDINGRKISNLLNNGNFEMGSNSQKLELPESLSHGVYFLNISDGKNTSTVKIVK